MTNASDYELQKTLCPISDHSPVDKNVQDWTKASIVPSNGCSECPVALWLVHLACALFRAFGKAYLEP